MAMELRDYLATDWHGKWSGFSPGIVSRGKYFVSNINPVERTYGAMKMIARLRRHSLYSATHPLYHPDELRSHYRRQRIMIPPRQSITK